MSSASMLAAISAASARSVLEAPRAVVLDDASRKRAREALAHPDSPLNPKWLKAKLDVKVDLADETRKLALDLGRQVGPEVLALVEEMLEQRRVAIEAIREKERAEQRAKDEAEWRRKVDARVVAWRALPRRERESILLEEKFDAIEGGGTALQLVKALRRVEALSDADIDEMIPDVWEWLSPHPMSSPPKPNPRRF